MATAQDTRLSASDGRTSNGRVCSWPQWISNAWVDLLFLILTPALVIPAISLARLKYSVEDIALYVTAFGATGHHLPGLLRAYGDRELFLRYRVRFLLAPLILVSSCVAFSYWNLQGLMLIGVTWGVWHSLMQVYGFLRIYDGKVRSVDAWTARLDFLMCLGWFVWGFLNSSGRQSHWIDTYYRSGGWTLTVDQIQHVTQLWGALTILVTAGFAVNALQRWRQGTPPSALKLLSLATSVAFWWYAMVLVDNPLLSAALFEIFHDVQYLTIVWIFNRGRVTKSDQAGSFTRFLFRRSGAMIGLYLALVFGYGIVGLSPDLTSFTVIKPALYGLLLASGLLHFYYDGFIWKFREPSARRALNLTDDAATSTPAWEWSGPLSHAAKWLFLVLPAAGLAYAQLHTNSSRLEQLQRLAATVPQSWNAHYLLASELARNGQTTEAIAELERAAALSPHQARVHKDLADAYRNEGLPEQARAQYLQAIQWNPRDDAATEELCKILLELKRYRDAEPHLRQLLARFPQASELRNALGSALAGLGKNQDAVAQFREAIRLDPRATDAHNNLGLMSLRLGKPAAAAESFQEALRLDPNFAEAHHNLAVVYAQLRDWKQANTHYRRVLELEPEHPRALHSLAWNLATAEDDSVRDGPEALELAQKLTQDVDPMNPSYWTTLGAALAETGQFDQAVDAAETAQKLARQRGDQGAYFSAAECLKVFQQTRPYRDLGRR